MKSVNNGAITVFSFDWEEVNASVFKNAQIYALKKSGKNLNKIAVLVPENFAYLYKDADIVFTISKKTLKNFGIDEYRNVLEYTPQKDNIFVHRMNRLVSFLIKFFNDGYLNKIIGTFYQSSRQKKFYIQNGLEKLLVDKVTKGNSNAKYHRTNDFYDIAKDIYYTYDIEKHFIRQFNYLFNMINDKNLYNADFDIKILKEYPEVEQYYMHKGKKILLRTRNFKRKATAHNSKEKILYSLISELLKQDEDLMVLNLGLPILKLNINNSRYIEIDHNMSFSSELSLCQESNFCIMTAEAGLFTAYAASNINIVQYDNEWIPLNSNDFWSPEETPVELFEARRNIGMRDLDIRSDLVTGNYSEIADKIIRQCNEVNKTKIVKYEDDIEVIEL